MSRRAPAESPSAELERLYRSAIAEFTPRIDSADWFLRPGIAMPASTARDLAETVHTAALLERCLLARLTRRYGWPLVRAERPVTLSPPDQEESP